MTELLKTRGAVPMRFEEVSRLPRPISLGIRHKPHSHVEIIRAVSDCLKILASEHEIADQRFWVADHQNFLFGLFDLGRLEGTQYGLSVFLSSSVNKKHAISLALGRYNIQNGDSHMIHVGMRPVHKRSTVGLDLLPVVAAGVINLKEEVQPMLTEAVRREQIVISEETAKAIVLDSFHKTWPVRQMGQVYRDLFSESGPKQLSVIERSFARAAESIQPFTRVDCLTALDKVLGTQKGKPNNVVPISKIA